MIKTIIPKSTRNFFSLIWLALFLTFSSVSFSQPNSPNNKAKAGFRASVVKMNITPSDSQWLLGYGPRKSTGVLDSIYHRIVILDDGETQFCLVSTELCVISPSIYDRVAAKLEKQTGVKPINFLWTLTHTHSAPEVGPASMSAVYMGERFNHELDEAYTDLIEQKLIEGVKLAQQRLVPAKLGVGWGFSQANINRRAVDADGKVSIGLNPDKPVDRRIGLIRIDRENGTPLTLIANYPMHGTVLGDDYVKISGDAPGVVSEYVEQKIGAPLVFINGAEGNMAPIYSVYSDEISGHLGQFRVLLGDRILEANSEITSTSGEVKLTTGSLTVETPRKEGLGWAPDLDKYTKKTKGGTDMVLLPLRFLRINSDIAIWSAPLELFCEISNEIRDLSPFPYTFYFGLSNGWLGYMLPETEYVQGGYEPFVSPFSPKGGSDMKAAVVSYLKGEMSSKGTDR